METRRAAETEEQAQHRVQDAIASGLTIAYSPYERDESGFSIKARLYVYVHGRRTGAIPGGPVNPGSPTDCADAIIFAHAAGRERATNESQIAFFVNRSIHMPASATTKDGIPKPFSAGGAETPLHTLSGDAGKSACARFITREGYIVSNPKGYVVRRIADTKPVALEHALGLTPIKNSYETEIASAANYRGGSESERHKALKVYIAENPCIVNLSSEAGPGIVEKALPSGDTVDVYFSFDALRTAVEVKSRISPRPDIVRGLYQCVKYRAVLGACVVAENSEDKVDAVLLLESTLPADLTNLRTLLDVKVIENVQFPFESRSVSPSSN